MTTAVVVRLDSDGDVLLSGPAVRAVAAQCDRVLLLCGPRGAAAAQLLPGVDYVLVWHCPWVDPEPEPVRPADVAEVVAGLQLHQPDLGLILTSASQSPLPTALVLRLAGVPWLGAISHDYPGSLLDLRHRPPEQGLHEVQRMLSLAAAAGFPAVGEDLAVRQPLPDTRRLTGPDDYVVVHPGASVPSRATSAVWQRQLVVRLAAAGERVVVTGGPDEASLTRAVAGDHAQDLGGGTSLPELADVLRRARCVVVGNTGPAHLAAAVGTPVVSLFAPVVPQERWQPWGVPAVVLGDQSAACAGTRARECPVPGHPCLDGISHDNVVAAMVALHMELSA
jgi:ADP-heptose:LPS heptosyltransferase